MTVARFLFFFSVILLYFLLFSLRFEVASVVFVSFKRPGLPFLYLVFFCVDSDRKLRKDCRNVLRDDDTNPGHIDHFKRRSINGFSIEKKILVTPLSPEKFGSFFIAYAKINEFSSFLKRGTWCIKKNISEYMRQNPPPLFNKVNCFNQ